MKTRGKTAKEIDGDASADVGPVDTHILTVSIPEDVDQDLIAQLLPEIPDLSSVTPEGIVHLYRLLSNINLDLSDVHRKLDELRADVDRKDVELDQALQDKESSSKDLESSIEAIQDELSHVKQERDQLVEVNDALKTQVTSLSSSQTSSSSEVEALKHRVEDTEREKRELVGVVSRLKQESSQREEEIQTLRSNLKEARQEHQALESQVRELRSTETSTKFKVDSLVQQLQLAQTETERTNAELTSKADEFAKYRRTKHAEAVNLQASYDSLIQEHNSTQASLKALQSAHTTQTNQLTQALSKIQALTGQLAEQEAKYASEANGLKRLVTMMEDRENHAKEIVEGIEREWAGVGERAERREEALREQIERESKRRGDAEKRIEHLETVMQRMGRGELPIPGTPSRIAGTPDYIDGMVGLSPTVALASKSQRSGKTFTEVYADYVRLQEDFAKKTAEYDHMDRTLTSVLAQIEERAPILSQQRAEYERVQSEASQLASQLSQALLERDSQAKFAEENGQKLLKSTAENGLLQNQLNDLGRQVQTLLRDIARREDPTIPSDEDLDIIPFTPANDVDEVITNSLVLFRNIEGLQEQNQRLLKITRQLGDKMESEEKEYKASMEREQAEAVQEAHEAIQELAAQLETQKKNSDNIIKSYVKERDALKAMLARAESNAGRSLNGIQLQPPTIHPPQNDVSKALEDVQTQFEAYKMEMGVDSSRLRDDLTASQREVHELGTALAKANAKIEYLNDRHRMHQEQFQLHNRELDDLTKRNQALFDQWTRIDIECSRVTEDLHLANARLEQLRNECANLRAEKKIWESVQNRLVEENRTLAMERSHLSDLMANVQKMHNDLERSGQNDRRRLESQLQMLEGQTQDLRTQLSRERDALRHASLQKDLEAKESQTRIDKAAQELAKTRESLIGAETSKKHFEERADQLSKQLQGLQEKLGVYERRPATTMSGPVPSSDPDLTREQQLEQEVAELRSALKVAEVDLASAKAHVEQFKEISQANEVALSNLNSTFDEYKTSMESQLTRNEAEYKALQEKLAATNDELAHIREQHTDLQKTFETERTNWKNDKKTLEETIVDMTTSEQHLESDRTSREQEVRDLEGRAKAAEERYSHEVVAHAESIKTIEMLRLELSGTQAKARESLSASETAQAKLVASETSWQQQRETLDKEVADLNTRCQDLSTQNAILHQHLESVTSQAARIRQAADDSSAPPSGAGDSSDDMDTKLAELRSVVTYLRKEKEIVDLQYELSKQENVRFKAQIDYLSQALEEARATISEEREQAVESAASAAQHAELVERINQLNILRESNATLRADCENYSKKSRELEARLKQLAAELDPAKEQARAAQAELEACKAQVQRLEQESRGWQERNKQLLSKYDRIDPAEVQALKDDIERLNAELTETQKQKDEFEAFASSKQTVLDETTQKHQNLEKLYRTHKETAVKNLHSFRNKLADLNSQKTALSNEKQELEAKITSLESENQSLRTQQSNAGDQSGADAEELKKQESLVVSLRGERDKLLAEKESWVESNAASTSENPESWETEKTELLKARDEALEKLKVATEDAHKASEDIKNIRMQNEKFQSRLASIAKARASEQERIEATIAEAVEKAKGETQSATTTSASSEEATKKHVEELETLRKELTTKHDAELKAAVDAAAKQSSTPSVDQPSIDTAIAEHQKAFEEKHSKDIEAARESGRMEAGAKLKIKDSQLFKAQKRVKEFEAQIREWEAAGAVPANSLSNIKPIPAVLSQPTSAILAVTGTSTMVAANPPNPQANAPKTPIGPNQQRTGQTPVAQNQTASTSSGIAGVNSTPALPRKPGHPTPTGPAGTGLGRGMNALRGGRGAPLGASRTIPPRALPVKSTAPASAGMTIIGAAAAAAASSAKRPREEPDSGTQEDSLAKRLKPADVAAAPPPTATKPVQLRRPPPGTS